MASIDAAAGETCAELLKAGRLESPLCFVAEEDKPVGALVLVRARSESVQLAFAACTAYSDPHVLGQLYAQAAAALREQGIGFIAARFKDNERELYFQTFRWKWILAAGFVPPTLDEASLNYAVKPLLDNVRPSCQPLQLPPELGIPEPECLFYGTHKVTEEQLGEEIYLTRQRRRLAERTAIILFIIGVVTVGCIKGGRTVFINIIPMLGIGMYLLWRNIFIPRRVTRSVLESRRSKGLNGMEDCLFFGRERFICFAHGSASAIYSYDNITAVYDKGSYMFLMSSAGRDSASGWYVKELEPADKFAFMEHIRSRSPQVRFKR